MRADPLRTDSTVSVGPAGRAPVGVARLRAAVREDAIELHVRSETGAAGLRAFRDRLAESTPPGTEWRATRRTE